MSLNPTIAAFLAPFLPAVGKSLTPVANLTAALDRGYQLTDTELSELMYALHFSVIGTPLMQFLETSFEDMGDIVSRASASAAIDQLGATA